MTPTPLFLNKHWFKAFADVYQEMGLSLPWMTWLRKRMETLNMLNPPTHRTPTTDSPQMCRCHILHAKRHPNDLFQKFSVMLINAKEEVRKRFCSPTFFRTAASLRGKLDLKKFYLNTREKVSVREFLLFPLARLIFPLEFF